MAELLARVKDAGASSEVMAIVASCFEAMSGTSPGQVRDIIRQYERERRNKSRKKSHKTKANAEANDAAPTLQKVPDIEASEAEKACDVSLPISNSEVETEKKGKKKLGDARARGTRLPKDWQPNDEDRQFAIDHGVDPDQLRDEFVDFWVGVPGQRGVKLDWRATWRNRVRAVAARGKPNVRHSEPTDLQAALADTRRYARSGNS